MITEKTEINESERREEMTKDRQSANENKGGNGMGEEKENVKWEEKERKIQSYKTKYLPQFVSSGPLLAE